MLEWQQAKSRAQVTKVSGTTAYSVNDVWSDASGNILVWKDFFSEDGRGRIIESAVAMTSANQSTLPGFRVFLFTSDPGLQTDNAGIDLTDAEALGCVGRIDFPAAQTIAIDATSGADGNSLNDQHSLQINVAQENNKERRLWGIPVLLNAYTPITLEVLTVDLQVTGNG